MANNQEVTQRMIDCASAFPAYDKAKLAPAMHHYIKALAAYSVKDIDAALDTIIQSNKYFPSVSEVVAACRKAGTDNETKYHISAPDILRRELIGLERTRAFGRFISAEWDRLAKKLEGDNRIFSANYVRQKAGLPTVDYHPDETAMIAHDRAYEAAHPFTGERWWEAQS